MYVGNLPGKILSIASFMQKNQQGEFSAEALRLRQTLKCALRQKRFVWSELANQLIEDPRSGIKQRHSKTPNKTIRYNLRDGFLSDLDKLITLGLLIRVGKRPCKNTTQTDEYQPTFAGEILDKMIDVFDSCEPVDHSKLFRLISNFLKSQRSTEAHVTAIFYENCLSKGISVLVLRTIRDVLQSNEPQILFTDLLDMLIFFRTPIGIEGVDLEYQKEAFRIFRIILPKLDRTSRRLILIILKNRLEAGILEGDPASGWEKQWLRYAGNSKKIVLYGICTSCRKSYPVVVDPIKYFQRVNIHSTHTIQRCRICHKNNAVRVGIQTSLPE